MLLGSDVSAALRRSAVSCGACGSVPACWAASIAACCAAASRSWAAIGSGNSTGSGVRTGNAVSPRRTTVSVKESRASVASASMVSGAPLTTQRIIHR